MPSTLGFSSHGIFAPKEKQQDIKANNCKISMKILQHAMIALSLPKFIISFSTSMHTQKHTDRGRCICFFLNGFSSILTKTTKTAKGKRKISCITLCNVLWCLPSQNGSWAAHWATLPKFGCTIRKQKCFAVSPIAQILHYCGARTLHSRW